MRRVINSLASLKQVMQEEPKPEEVDNDEPELELVPVKEENSKKK